MDHIVIWSPRALDDVDDIAAYIAQDSEVYAAAVVRNILRTVRTLSTFPFRGRVVPNSTTTRSGKSLFTATG